MRQNLAAEIINCYERARQARQKAEVAINEEFKTDFLAAEGRWLSLAYSYEGQHRVSRTIAEFDRRARQVQSTGCFESTVARSSPTT